MPQSSPNWAKALQDGPNWYELLLGISSSGFYIYKLKLKRIGFWATGRVKFRPDEQESCLGGGGGESYDGRRSVYTEA